MLSKLVFYVKVVSNLQTFERTFKFKNVQVHYFDTYFKWSLRHLKDSQNQSFICVGIMIIFSNLDKFYLR